MKQAWDLLILLKCHGNIHICFAAYEMYFWNYWLTHLNISAVLRECISFCFRAAIQHENKSSSLLVCIMLQLRAVFWSSRTWAERAWWDGCVLLRVGAARVGTMQLSPRASSSKLRSLSLIRTGRWVTEAGSEEYWSTTYCVSASTLHLREYKLPGFQALLRP